MNNYLTMDECTACGKMFAHLTHNIPGYVTSKRWEAAFDHPGIAVSQAAKEAESQGIDYDRAAVRSEAERISSEHADWRANNEGGFAFAHAYYRTSGILNGLKTNGN